jgi:hypothetical protein
MDCGTTVDDVVVPPDNTITCDFIQSSKVAGLHPLHNFGFNVTFDRVTGGISPEIIRFASPTTAVKIRLVFAGGSVDF